MSLESNPLIALVKMLELTPEIEQQLGESAERVKEELQSVNVYAISYRSQDHIVNGYFGEPKEGTELPCIILNRGGSKEFGIWTDAKVLRALTMYASWGYLAIASQYSGCAGSEGKDELGGNELKDILIFRKFFKEYTRADKERIGMVGSSRGGMMVYRALAEVSWLKAAVSVAGVSNYFRSYELRPKLTQWHADMFNNTNEAELKKRSAVFWPEKFCKTTSLLMIHGTRDNKVSPLDSIELASKLYEHKVPFRLSIIEGADHRIMPFHQLRSEMIRRWLDRYVKNGESIPNLELDPE